MSDQAIANLTDRLDKLIALVERAVPKEHQPFDPSASDAFVFEAELGFLSPVESVNRVDIDLLVGIDLVRDKLIANTENFAKGYPANNVLLWGARGMGKSSLVKAAHKAINDDLHKSGTDARMKLIEIHREDISHLPALMRIIRAQSDNYLIFCDDLSFSGDDTDYKALKSALDGGVEGRPKNALFYATSNRRHLIPRDMIENERSTAINPSEAIEEKVSLSDRFGLWLGFHKCDQDNYLEMVKGYVARYGLDYDDARLEFEALEWAKTRGNRSGRVAWQFISDLAGRLGKPLPTE